MTRMTSQEARERIEQADRWEALCMGCSVPGVGKDNPRYYAARAMGAMHFEWRAMALRPMPVPTTEDLKRWAPLEAYARQMCDVHARGIDRARWELVRECVSDTPQEELEQRMRHYVIQLTPGEDIEARAARELRAFTQAVILAHEEAQSWRQI